MRARTDIATMMTVSDHESVTMISRGTHVDSEHIDIAGTRF
jgi:hypothetical protein